MPALVDPPRMSSAHLTVRSVSTTEVASASVGALAVEIVIPTTRPRVLVEHVLPALARCVPAPADVVVVLDGCGEESGWTGRTIRLPQRRGPAAARNAGVAAATAPVVLFLDDDVLVPPDLIGRVEAYFSDPAVVAVTGTFAPATGPGAENLCSRYKNDYMGYVCGEHAAPTRTLLTAVCAVRRDAFEAVGGFDVSIAEATVEDIELGQRLALRGRVAYDPALAVVHLKRYTPWGLAVSHWRRSRDMARLLLAKSFATRMADLSRSRDALALPVGFALGVGLVALALASPLLYLLGLTPVVAAGAGALALWAAFAVNVPFLTFLARRSGAVYALAGGSILVCELVITVLASSVATASFPVRNWRARLEPR